MTPVDPSGETGKTAGAPRFRSQILGSGLRAWELALILAISTIAFLFWGGPLWEGRVGASHVWRIGGSYLLVIPLVVAALARRQRASVGHCLGSIGTVWGAKMVITATLYAYVAPESATQYTPERTWETAPETETRRPTRESMTPSEGWGDVAGVITAQGTPLAQAVIMVEDMPATSFTRAPADIAVAIEHARYGQSIYVVSAQDRIALTNRDASLHMLRVTQDRRAIANIPIPPGAPAHPFVTPPSGLYQLSCENHESERALLVVVDHPFFSVTDAAGHFQLDSVPAGEHPLVVLREGHSPTRRFVTVAKNARLELSIDTD